MITAEDLRELENLAEEKGVSKLALMENAGKGIFKILKEKFDLKDKKILVVCYHGNNGGDGFVAARYLSDFCEVDVLFLGDDDKLKKEANVNYKRILHNEMIQLLAFEETDFEEYDMILDAIFGTGIKGKLDEDILNAIDNINNSKAYKVAVDVPTGMNPDTGEIYDRCVDADLVITFHDMKPGLEKLKDKTVIVDIGIPPSSENDILPK